MGRHGMRNMVPAAAVAIALAASLGAVGASAAPAQTPTGASMRASFTPNRLGASTALTLAMRFSGGGPEGVPAPLRREVLQLPAGLGIGLGGARICTKARLLSGGAASCPRGSLVGRGHAIAEARTGSLTSPEEVTISVYRGPDRAGRPALEILGQGETPLQERNVSTAVVEADRPPYGTRLTVTVPPIPTLHYEPDASFASLSLTLGGLGRAPRAHAASAAITVPRRCPAGGWPFAARFTFAGGATANASTRIACP